MNLIRNLSIKTRLMSILAFSLVILISFGILAIVEMQKLGNVTQGIYDNSMQVSNAAQEVKLDINKMHREARDLIIANDEAKIQTYANNIYDFKDSASHKLEIIKTKTKLEEVTKLEDEIRSIMDKWDEDRRRVIDLALEGNINEATKISQTKGLGYVNSIEEKLDNIYELEGMSAEDMTLHARNIVKSQRIVLISSLIVLSCIITILSILISKSILDPISILKRAMKSSVNVGELVDVKIQGNNEIVDMASHYNSLIKTLKNQFWVKDGQHRLGQDLSGNYDINEITQRSISFLSRFLEAGSGVFYLYDEENKDLNLNSSFAFTERATLSSCYVLGEGIIGQVALEKKAILLKNITKKDALVTTGIISESPLNIYAFPLVHEKVLYGVIELSSFEPFTELKQEFLKECSDIISINLCSSIQNEKIKRLLIESEKSEQKAHLAAAELQKANTTLEDQQRLLQMQTEELQQTNEELEEQQAMLQQQSAELQESNSILEEQQQQLEEQSNILNIQNQQLKTSRQELIQRSKQLELSNQYKSEFLANMSHELRTPLNSIILLSKLLINNEKEKLDEGHAEKIGIIYKSGNELLRLINDILDLSKIESGRMNLDATIFHSKDLIKDIKRIFKEFAEEKNIELIKEDRVNTELYGDKEKISQILRNLLSNSLKFTERGSVALKIEKDRYNSGIVLSVKDTGIGIKKEQLEMIFEEFQQGDGSISRRYGGTGLGLSISKKLIELMGGDIKVESTVGIGSEFTVFIPNIIRKTEEDANRLVACATNDDLEEIAVDKDSSFLEQVEEGKNNDNCLIHRTNTEYALSLRGKQILIVDDDPRNIFVLATLLEDFGAEVIEAENGQVAIEKLKSSSVDLILMDIMMPIMDGYDTIKCVRNDEKTKELPIIALTAKNLKDDRAKCIEAGADDYISKPVDYDIFLRLVKAWISKKG